jgi:ankyrin repeat protein
MMRVNDLLTRAVPAVVVSAVVVACSPRPVEQSPADQALPGARLAPAANIIDAVRSGQASTVRDMLAAGADVNAAEEDGSTILMWAIEGRQTELALELIEAGADASAVNRRGVSPIYLAARSGDAEVVEALLARGVDANTALPEGETVLMTAAKAGNADVVRALLEGGGNDLLGLENKADPNIVEGWQGQSALMWAAAGGYVDVMDLLIGAGADLDLHSQLIDAPQPNPDRLQGGFVYAKIPKGRFTALHFAARQGQLEAVRKLIDAGADLDAVDEEGTNALVLATLNGHLDVAGLLLAAGADPNVADSYGRTVLFVATDLNTIDANPRPAPKITSELKPIDIVKMALEKGADPNVELKKGLPAYLAQGGAHNPILDKGATPFLRAAMSGDLAIIDLLLTAGAKPLTATAEREPMKMGDREVPSNGRTTSLMAAAGVGWRDQLSRGRDEDAISLIGMLLEMGADINAANQSGDTALHGAALRGSTTIIRYLVDHGADVTARNEKGWLPLDIALGQPEERIPYNEATATLLKELTPVEVARAEPENEG